MDGGQDGISLYASVDYGKGNLDRQAAKQQNTDIRANGTLQLESGQDTTDLLSKHRGLAARRR